MSLKLGWNRKEFYINDFLIKCKKGLSIWKIRYQKILFTRNLISIWSWCDIPPS